MPRRGLCPHPEKKLWPLVDVGGPRCPCGCVWDPYEFVTIANHGARHDPKGIRLEVYRCRDRSGRELNHWHTTDQLKRERRLAAMAGESDGPVSSMLLSTHDIQTRTWSGHRRARPVKHAERRRLIRHRRW